MTKLQILIVALLVTMGIGCGVCVLAYKTRPPELDPTKKANEPIEITGNATTHSKEPAVVEVERLVYVDSWNAKTQYSGILKSKRTSDLGFEQSGRIEKIYVEKGDRVKSGQVLAILNVDQIESQIRKLKADKSAADALLVELKVGPRAETVDALRATVREREAELQMAKNNLERRQRLVNTEAISREDFEQAQSAVVKLEAARVTAQKSLEDLQLGTRIEKIRTQEATIASLRACPEISFFDFQVSLA